MINLYFFFFFFVSFVILVIMLHSIIPVAQNALILYNGALCIDVSLDDVIILTERITVPWEFVDYWHCVYCLFIAFFSPQN